MTEEATCPTCGSVLPAKGSTGPRRVYCDRACKRRAPHNVETEGAGRRRRATARRKLYAVCLYCGVPFLLTRRDGGCPDATCRRKARNLAARFLVGRARARRAGHGAVVERFHAVEVFQRDDYTCHVCGGPTSRDLGDGLSPASATIDHVIALEDGGAHTLENAATAHFRCNVVRGGRPVEEGRRRVLAGLGVPVPDDHGSPVPVQLSDLVTTVAAVSRVEAQVIP